MENEQLKPVENKSYPFVYGISFKKALQTYFQDHKYKIATPDSMIASFEKVNGSSLKEVFSSWINGKVQILQIS